MDAGWKDEFWYITRGAFLKFDMPFVFEQIIDNHANDPSVERDYFFYTDTDVLFFKVRCFTSTSL